MYMCAFLLPPSLPSSLPPSLPPVALPQPPVGADSTLAVGSRRPLGGVVMWDRRGAGRGGRLETDWDHAPMTEGKLHVIPCSCTRTVVALFIHCTSILITPIHVHDPHLWAVLLLIEAGVCTYMYMYGVYMC